MLQNSTVTAFTAFELLRENQLGGRGIKLLPTKIKVKGRICQATHRHPKASNKYKKNYDKNIESSYIEYLDVNNLYE